MSSYRIETEGISLVVAGAFSPASYTPGWFAAHKLLSAGDAEAADVKVVTNDVSQFQTDQLIVQVTSQQIEINTSQSPYEAARDLMLGALSLAGSPPLRALGFNLRRHYQVEDVEAWHRAGHAIVPQEFWNDLLEDPGMRRVQMQGKREDGLEGNINVQLEPSVKITNGIYVSVNSHFELNSEEPGSLDLAIELLETRFESELAEAMRLTDRLVEQIA